jgi:hypothetical protein
MTPFCSLLGHQLCSDSIHEKFICLKFFNVVAMSQTLIELFALQLAVELVELGD